jgi:hypothetical protein
MLDWHSKTLQEKPTINDPRAPGIGRAFFWPTRVRIKTVLNLCLTKYPTMKKGERRAKSFTSTLHHFLEASRRLHVPSILTARTKLSISTSIWQAATRMGWTSGTNICWQDRKKSISGEIWWKKKSRKTKIKVATLYRELSEVDGYLTL